MASTSNSDTSDDYQYVYFQEFLNMIDQQFDIPAIRVMEKVEKGLVGKLASETLDDPDRKEFEDWKDDLSRILRNYPGYKRKKMELESRHLLFLEKGVSHRQISCGSDLGTTEHTTRNFLMTPKPTPAPSESDSIHDSPSMLAANRKWRSSRSEAGLAEDLNVDAIEAPDPGDDQDMTETSNTPTDACDDDADADAAFSVNSVNKKIDHEEPMVDRSVPDQSTAAGNLQNRQDENLASGTPDDADIVCRSVEQHKSIDSTYDNSTLPTSAADEEVASGNTPVSVFGQADEAAGQGRPTVTATADMHARGESVVDESYSSKDQNSSNDSETLMVDIDSNNSTAAGSTRSKDDGFDDSIDNESNDSIDDGFDNSDDSTENHSNGSVADDSHAWTKDGCDDAMEVDDTTGDIAAEPNTAVSSGDETQGEDKLTAPSPPEATAAEDETALSSHATEGGQSQPDSPNTGSDHGLAQEEEEEEQSAPTIATGAQRRQSRPRPGGDKQANQGPNDNVEEQNSDDQEQSSNKDERPSTKRSRRGRRTRKDEPWYLTLLPAKVKNKTLLAALGKLLVQPPTGTGDFPADVVLLAVALYSDEALEQFSLLLQTFRTSAPAQQAEQQLSSGQDRSQGRAKGKGNARLARITSLLADAETSMLYNDYVTRIGSRQLFEDIKTMLGAYRRQLSTQEIDEYRGRLSAATFNRLKDKGRRWDLLLGSEWRGLMAFCFLSQRSNSFVIAIDAYIDPKLVNDEDNVAAFRSLLDTPYMRRLDALGRDLEAAVLNRTDVSLYAFELTPWTHHRSSSPKKEEGDMMRRLAPAVLPFHPTPSGAPYIVDPAMRPPAYAPHIKRFPDGRLGLQAVPPAPHTRAYAEGECIALLPEPGAESSSSAPSSSSCSFSSSEHEQDQDYEHEGENTPSPLSDADSTDPSPLPTLVCLVRCAAAAGAVATARLETLRLGALCVRRLVAVEDIHDGEEITLPSDSEGGGCGCVVCKGRRGKDGDDRGDESGVFVRDRKRKGVFLNMGRRKRRIVG